VRDQPVSDVPDLGQIFEQAMQLQQQLAEAQAEAQATEVEGRAGGGSVTVTMTGGGEVLRVRIDPSVVNAHEVDLLEDLVVAALHDAATKAREVQADAMGGLDLGGLGGLAGGFADDDAGGRALGGGTSEGETPGGLPGPG